jgi:hypothetical protein
MPFTWDHLLENGVFGSKLPIQESRQVLIQEDVMRVMASTLFIVSTAIDFVKLAESLADLFREVNESPVNNKSGDSYASFERTICL